VCLVDKIIKITRRFSKSRKMVVMLNLARESQWSLSQSMWVANISKYNLPTIENELV